MLPMQTKWHRKRFCASGATPSAGRRDRVRFTTWLFRIARNLAIDRHRKNRETNDDDRRRRSSTNRRTPRTRSTPRRRRKMMRTPSRNYPNASAPRWCCAISTECPIQDAAAVLEVTRRCARVAALARPPNAEDHVAPTDSNFERRSHARQADDPRRIRGCCSIATARISTRWPADSAAHGKTSDRRFERGTFACWPSPAP